MSSMLELVDELWMLKRDIISDGYDQALMRLAEELPLIIHQVPSGARVWTWTVPEKWTCHEAYLESLDGKRLIDYADHPLHVVSYSLPFEGEVSRDELMKHLHVHKHLPDAVPFMFKYYQRDWGLCCTQTLRDSLRDEKYRVVIRSEFTPGTLKIGEVYIPGEHDECFVLAAHLDHPAMVNDDLSGVVVGVEVMRRLLAGPKPHCGVRLLLFPETLGSIAYLSTHESEIPNMLGGLFLEMLGNDAPHALQTSFQANSSADEALVAALREREPGAYVGGFRTVIDNDERQFNAPGVRVPMLSLSRVVNPQLPESRFYPYREYHSSLDTPDIISERRLEDSAQTVLELVRAFDKIATTLGRSDAKRAKEKVSAAGKDARYLVNLFKGEVFASGYGLWVDYASDAAGHKRRFEIMDRCDGTRRVADIAEELSLPAAQVWDVIEKLLDKNLVELSDTPQPTDPHLN
jgi:aminopeptidase-like protein